MELACQHCGGQMRMRTISSGNCGGIALASITFCAGVILFFIVPIIGWVLGPVICLCALFMGGRRRKVWKCDRCGYVFDRA